MIFALIRPRGGARQMRKRVAFEHTADGMRALDLDKIQGVAFPYTFEAVGAPLPADVFGWHQLLESAGAAGFAITWGDIRPEALRGGVVRRQPGSLFATDKAPVYVGVLPLDFDGVLVEFDPADVLGSIWRNLSVRMGLQDCAAVLQITATCLPLLASPARVRFRAYLLIAEQVSAAQAANWVRSLPEDLCLDLSAFDRSRPIFLTPPALVDGAGKPMPDFLPRWGVAAGQAFDVPRLSAIDAEPFRGGRARAMLPLGDALSPAAQAQIAHWAAAAALRFPVGEAWHRALRAQDMAICNAMAAVGFEVTGTVLQFAAAQVQAGAQRAVLAGAVARPEQELHAELLLEERLRSLAGAWARVQSRRPSEATDERVLPWPTTAGMMGRLEQARVELQQLVDGAVHMPGSTTVIEAPPGTGKTEAAARAAVALEAAGDVVEVYVPNHRLAREWIARAHALGAQQVAHYVGRGHVYPDGVRACVRWDTLRMAMPRIGTAKAMRKFCVDTVTGAVCPHAVGCRYLDVAGKIERAAIRVFPHAVLELPFTSGEAEFLPPLKGPPRRRVVLVDETPAGLLSDLAVPLADLAQAPVVLRELLALARRSEDASVSLQALAEAVGGPVQLRTALTGAVERMEPSLRGVRPDTPDAAIRARLRAARGRRSSAASAKRVRLWKLSAWLLRQVMDLPPGTVLRCLALGKGRLHVRSVASVADMPRVSAFKPAIVLLDATPVPQLLRTAGFPKVSVAAVACPPALFTVQVVGAPSGAAVLNRAAAVRFAEDAGDDGDEDAAPPDAGTFDPVERRLLAMAPGKRKSLRGAGKAQLGMLWLRWAIRQCLARDDLLTVLPKGVRGQLGLARSPGVLHFGALRGLDSFGSHAVALLAGSPRMPLPEARLLAGALWPGAYLGEPERPVRVEYGVRDLQGRAAVMQVAVAADGRVDAVWNGFAQAELKQAVFRLRAHTRELAPAVWIACGAPVADVVGRLVEWEAVVPTAGLLKLMAPMLLDQKAEVTRRLKELRADAALVQAAMPGEPGVPLWVSTRAARATVEKLPDRLARANAALALVWELTPPDARCGVVPRLGIVRRRVDTGNRGKWRFAEVDFLVVEREKPKA